MSTDEFVSEFVKLLNDEKPHDNTAERILHHKKTRLAGDSVEEFERTPQQEEDEAEREFFDKKMIDGVNYIDYTTKVIFITFNCYEPSQDRFITT